MSKVYKIPQAIAAALATERPQFIRIAAAQIRSGELKMTPEDTAVIVELLSDLIEDKRTTRGKFQVTCAKLKEARRSLEGQAGVLNKIREELLNLDADEEHAASEACG